MREKEYLKSIGAWECEQKTPHHLYTVGKHTEMVVNYCMEHGAGDELIRAAWLHDAGKVSVKYNDGIYDHFTGHPSISAEIAKNLGESDYVIDLIRYHDSHRKLKDCGDDISGKQIKYAISRHKSGFYDGFDLDRYYCDDVMLRFTFSKNKQANNADEEMLIHHTIEYDFDLDFADIQQEAVNSIKKRIDYIYISNVSYLEYSYTIEKNHVQLSFNVLTNEASVSSVVNHLISQDIMIFSRGW